MGLAEKVADYKLLMQRIEFLEEQKKALTEEILSEMVTPKVEVGGYRVSSYVRLSIRVSLEQARLLGATKMEEQVDKERIKEIHKGGVEIEGVKDTRYLRIQKVSENVGDRQKRGDGVL